MFLIASIDIIVQLILFTIPALIVFLISYSMLKKFMDNANSKASFEYKIKTHDQFNQLKLQAYERLTILIDRVSPDNSITRLMNSKMNATQFKYKLITEINEEYSHNVSQQLYVSLQTWALVKNLKNQLFGIIEYCYEGLEEGDSGMELGKAILGEYAKMENSPSDAVVNFIKKEISIVL